MIKEILDLKRIVGLKDFIIILLLAFIEMIINIPYFIIKLIMYPIWAIYDQYFDGNEYMIAFASLPVFTKYINKISKKIKENKDV